MAKKKTTKKTTKHKLHWSWPAFCFGPLWYAIHGLWIPTLFMVIILFMSGLVFVLPIAIYCGVRFDEDHQELKEKVKG